MHVYKNDLFLNLNFSLILGDCLTNTSYPWNGCEYISEENAIKFSVTVVDEHKNIRSDVVTKRLTLPKTELELTVDCTINDIKANWKLMSYPHNINEYCLKYQCGSGEEKKMVGQILCCCK